VVPVKFFLLKFPSSFTDHQITYYKREHRIAK